MHYQLYYNPKCSTCQKTKRLLAESGLEPQLIYYLDEGVSPEEVVTLSKKLGMHPKEFIREKDLGQFDIENTEYSVEEWSEIISENPAILQRPILVSDDVAIVARPPEKALEMLNFIAKG